ncbi:MAG TPA: TPM domain-containing protein, partial [Gemmataceae bacterium]|nr:TPM domain-containing protein [Gemmataceae bacterium]
MRGIPSSLRYTLIACLLAFAWCAGAAQPALADVRDKAELFKPETVSKADQIISQIEAKHKKEVIVETFASVPPGKEDEAKSKDDTVRNTFFQEWAVDRAQALNVNGIYILITKSPGHVQVEVGKNTAIRDFTRTERDHLRGLLVKAFGEKHFDAGLLEGVQYVQQTMDAQMPAAGVRRGVGQTPAPAAPGNHKAASTEELGLGGKLMGMICIGLVAV